MTYTSEPAKANTSIILFNKQRLRGWLSGIDGSGMPNKIEWALALEEIAGELRSELARSVQPQPEQTPE